MSGYLDQDYKLVVFDLDGTLAEPASGGTFRKSGEQYIWLPRREDMLHELHRLGIAIAIASNQGGIAAGHINYPETEQAIHNLLSSLGFHVPWLMCPYVGIYSDSENWRSYAPWRKPSATMILMLMQQYPQLHLSKVLLVGDRQEDEYAARNAGVDYVHVVEFMRPWFSQPNTSGEDIPF